MFCQMRYIMLIYALTGSVLFANAQEGKTGELTGKLVNEQGEAVAGVEVSISYLKQLVFTDADGAFHLNRVPFGIHTLKTGAGGTDTFRISVNKPATDLGIITISSAIPIREFAPGDAADNEAIPDRQDGGGSRVSSLLGAGRDPFQNTAAYTFGAYHFRQRGYRSAEQQVFINGALMNDAETGDAYWALWGGLNDAFKRRGNSYGLFPGEAGPGGLNGSVDMDATAMSQRKQDKLTWSVSNRAYRNRVMLTHNSGVLSGGWAYALCISKRWSEKGYVDGTYYDGYSLYAAAGRQLYGGHSINLTAFGAYSDRARSAPVTQEVTELTASTTYNPDWGYQDGKIRNARVVKTFQPVLILSHEYHPSDKTRWRTALSYQFGKARSSSLDWYNGADPRPDYYRYLPSWQRLLYANDSATGALRAQTLAEQWRTDPAKRQIDWARLYDVNYTNLATVYNINGNPADSLTGYRSVYVLSDDVDDKKSFGFSTSFQKAIGERVSLYGGLSYGYQKTESYKELSDLLGGEFYLDVNQFAEIAYPANGTVDQNDLDHPNRPVRKGDKYAYDYFSSFTKLTGWGQAAVSFDHLDAFVCASAGYNAYQREGLVRNGLYANSSLGKDALQAFNEWGIKGGLTYKVNGRHYLFLNGSLTQEAPLFDNTYISPHTRNLTIANPCEQKIASLEAGYLLRSPRLNGRMVGYVTEARDASEIRRFYSDDDRFRSYVNYVLQNIATRSTGLELAMDVKLSTSLNVTGAAAIGQAFYTNRPNVTIYKDNDTATLAVPRTVYVKDFYLGLGPQSAYSLAFNFRSRQYWYGSLSFNYFDRNYVEIAPDRRSQEAADRVEAGSDQYHELFDQERLPSFVTVDLFIGRSLLLSRYFHFLPRNTYLYLNLGINNLMGRKDIKTGGFEQLRYDFKTNSPATFPSKYFYAPGRNYFLNLSLKI